MENNQEAMEVFKVCTKCGNELPATTEYFSKHKLCKGGLNSACKCCMAEKANKYYHENIEVVRERRRLLAKKNKEKIRLQQKKSVDKNKEHYIAYGKKWRQENKELKASIDKEWRNKNADRIKLNLKKYREKNLETVKDGQKKAYLKKRDHYINRAYEYAKNNPDKCREWSAKKGHKRRDKQKSLPVTLTRKEWEECKEYFNHSCVYCGKPMTRLTRDHVIPVSSNGGYTKDNILPACKSCNSSKADKEMVFWFTAQQYFSESRLEKIKNWINQNTP